MKKDRELYRRFGDHTNDIKVIKKAGIDVTVAIADPQLKAVADYITTGEWGWG